MADDVCLYWHADELLVLPDGTKLTAEPVRGGGLRIDDVSQLTLRFRQGGERCQPVGRDRSNSLKKLLQEYALEPWWRERIPLFYIEEQIVAVGDLWVCQGWQCGADEEGLKITWQTNSL
jgi:tRNA(Ile)-lysidine synthase